MTQSTQTQNKPKESIREYLEGEFFQEQVARSLPDGMKAERFVQSAITAVIRNRKLLECTRESLYKCLMDLSTMGLVPDGRRAHLIPFKDQCTVIVDYKGIAELVRRNGDVAHIHCDVVGRNDQFVCRFGSGGKLEHVPQIVDRGDIYCVYSYVRLKSGEEEWDVMNVKEIEKARARSWAANDGPWVKDWNEMAKKTVFRRHSKTMALSPLTRMAVEYGEDEDVLTHTVPAKVPPRSARGTFLPAGDDFIDLTVPQSPPQTVPEPARAPEPPKQAKAPSTSAPAPEPPPAAPKPAPRQAPAAKKAAQPAPEAKPDLFADDPDSESDADKLIVALHRDGIKWESFCHWIASTGALGQNVALPIPVSELKAELLADCVQNYQANIEEFRRWEASLS